MRFFFYFLLIFFLGCSAKVEKKLVKKKEVVTYKINNPKPYYQDDTEYEIQMGSYKKYSYEDNKTTVNETNVSEINKSKPDDILKILDKNLTHYNASVKEVKYKNKLMLLVNLVSVVHFDTDKYKIKKKYEKNLIKIIKVLKDANKSVLIVGHTDSVGSDRYNQALSELRAREVYKFFIKNGFDKSNLDYIGYGEEQPIATNATAKGRAKNRRVELFVDDNITVMYQYLKHRDINTSFLNNHNKLRAGKIEKTLKGWSKNISEAEIKKKFVKLSKPLRDNLNINLQKRVIIINLPKRELKEK